MAVSIVGSCHSCRKHLIILKMVESRLIVVIVCSQCGEAVNFDLEFMVDSLKGDKPNYDRMLEEFVPKGEPN